MTTTTKTTTQWALEGAPIRDREPGKLYASAPFYDTREEAEDAASSADARRPDLPPTRLLVRDDPTPGTPWRLA